MINTEQLREMIRLYGPTQAEFAKQLGVTQPTIANWLAQGKVPLRGQMLIAQTFLSGASEQVSAKEEGANSDTRRGGLYFSSMPVSAGQRDAFEDDRSADEIIIPGMKADAWFPVTGKSMSPTIEPGDIVGVQRLDSFDSVRPGNIYLIFTRESERMLKRIPQVDSQSDSVVLESDNPSFAPFSVMKESIAAVYKAVAIIRSLE